MGNEKDLNNSLTDIAFSKHAVAFLDILGFKDFIKKAEIPSSLEKDQFYELLNTTIPSTIDIDVFPSEVGLKCIQISDSFILSAPVDEQSSYPGLIAISIKAIQISHALLKIGLLVRGGIAVGNAYTTNSNIFGTSYVNAYQTELTANSPRILLHESAVTELDYLVEYKNMIKYSIFAKDNGQVILDSIYPHESYLNLLPHNNIFEQFQTYRNKIIENLQKLTKPEDQHVREKWVWTAQFFNEHINYFSAIRMDKIKLLTIPSFTLNYLNTPTDNWMKPFRSPGKRVIFSDDAQTEKD